MCEEYLLHYLLCNYWKLCTNRKMASNHLFENVWFALFFSLSVCSLLCGQYKASPLTNKDTKKVVDEWINNVWLTESSCLLHATETAVAVNHYLANCSSSCFLEKLSSLKITQLDFTMLDALFSLSLSTSQLSYAF